MHKFVCLGLLALLTGCATIIQPGPDRVMVDSKPQGAKVTLDGVTQGITPIMVQIPRSSDGLFRIEKEGYEAITVDRDKVVAGWTFANILVWPLFIVDLVTHNQGKYTEEPIYLELGKRENSGEQPKKDGT